MELLTCCIIDSDNNSSISFFKSNIRSVFFNWIDSPCPYLLFDCQLSFVVHFSQLLFVLFSRSPCISPWLWDWLYLFLRTVWHKKKRKEKKRNPQPLYCWSLHLSEWIWNYASDNVIQPLSLSHVLKTQSQHWLE